MTDNIKNEEMAAVDRFDISFRILGNEIIGISLNSQSKMKNWAMISIMMIFAMSALFSVLSPLIVEIMGMM